MSASGKRNSNNACSTPQASIPAAKPPVSSTTSAGEAIPGPVVVPWVSYILKEALSENGAAFSDWQAALVKMESCCGRVFTPENFDAHKARHVGRNA